MKIVVFIASAALLAASSASAQTAPDSCAAADRQRDKIVRGGGDVTDFLVAGESAPAHRAEREANAEARMNTLARLCLGDLTAQGQWATAAKEALHFGLYQDAVALQQAAIRAGQAKAPAN